MYVCADYVLAYKSSLLTKLGLNCSCLVTDGPILVILLIPNETFYPTHKIEAQSQDETKLNI